MPKLSPFLISIILLTSFRGGAYLTSYSIYYSSDSLKVDSHKPLLVTTLANKDNPADTLTINRLNSLAVDFFNVNPDSTLYYSNLALEKSRAIKYDKGIAEGLLYKGKAYVRKADYVQALKNLNEAKQLYINLKNEKGLSDCFLAYGSMYEVMADYGQASSYLKQALEIKKRIKDEPGIARAYNSLGIVLGDIGKSSDALDNYFRSLSINIKLHRNADAASNYNNIGTMLQSLKLYTKSLTYYQRAINLWIKTHNMVGISIAYLNIGEAFIAQKKYDLAIVYLYKSMKLAREHDDNDIISLAYANLGQCYAYKKQYKASLSNYSQALQIATVHNIDADKANAYIGLATLYNMQADYRQAHRYALLGKAMSDKLGNLSLKISATLQLSEALGGLKKIEAIKTQKHYYDLKDSLQNDEIIQKLTSFNLESNFAIKQRKVAERHQRMEARYNQHIQMRGLLIVIFLIIIIGLGITLIVYNKAKRNQKNINTVFVTAVKEKINELVKKNELSESHYSPSKIEELKEIMQLAVNNNPAFLIKFNKYDPEFCKKLLVLAPNLVAAEVEFCVMLRLNFETKEIARYAKISVRAVEAKKYRIRKKLNIPSYQDINIWMANIGVNILDG